MADYAGEARKRQAAQVRADLFLLRDLIVSWTSEPVLVRCMVAQVNYALAELDAGHYCDLQPIAQTIKAGISAVGPTAFAAGLSDA